MTGDSVLRCNGINGVTGEYLLPDLPARVVAAVARGEQLDAGDLLELKARHFAVGEASFGLVAGLDRMDVADAGWGVIFAADAAPEVRQALTPLLEHRKSQATSRAERYREFGGADGYRAGEASRDFLARHDVAPGQPANPARVPYYLLVVGEPQTIPYSVQYQLDVTYAVGRVCFDTVAEYERYAYAVVAAETATAPVPTRRAVLFGARNEDDAATQMSADELVVPLSERLGKRFSDWSVESMVGEGEATKARLAGLLSGGDRPGVLLTASHGMGFPSGDARQRSHQGALLCQDWPGPRRWRKPIPSDFYFAGDDIADGTCTGLVAFLFACYGAGTPQTDDFAREAHLPDDIAPHAFVGRLPQRLLGAGALAVVGHVERAWSYSFAWPRVGQQLDVFESALDLIMSGAPVGAAVEFFNDRYAALTTELDDARNDVLAGRVPDDPLFSGLWTAKNDARNYVVLGDPAVRASA